MNQCKRTGNKLDLCPELDHAVEDPLGIFERAYLDEGRVLILLDGMTFINLCPFCGGKLAED